MPGRRKYDWDKAREMYVEGIPDGKDGVRFPTLEEIASILGCAPSLVRRRAARERWSYQRELYKRQLEEERRKRKIAKFLEDISEVDSRLISLVKFVSAEIIKFAGEKARRGEPLTLKEAEKIAAVSEKLQRVINIMKGEPTDIVKSVVDDVSSLIDDPEFSAVVTQAVREYVNRKALTKRRKSGDQ